MSLITNKRARFEYEVLEETEAGLVLLGWEVKSLHAGQGNIRPAWISFRNGEMWICNFHIAPYKYAQTEQIPDREKKLLLKKREIERLEQKAKEKSCTLIPLSIQEKKGKLKCTIGLVKGRKKHEKRQVLKQRSQEKEARKMMLNRQ